jgi:8-oxo-dGTP pyrophosphatase MutT (NUDIX family)
MTEKATIVGGKKRRHRVEVFAIGPNNTILALSKGYNELPEFPGGGVDIGESNSEAGKREADEESGWRTAQHVVIDVGDYVFQGKDCPWFNKDGWQEEENIAVMCKAIKFDPSPAYGSENDANEFRLYPINQIIDETEKFSTREGVTDRKRLLAQFRLEVFKRILSLSKDKPIWCNW